MFGLMFLVSVISGLYTSLWGAFKDSPYEGLKKKTFPRSVYFSVAIFLLAYWLDGQSLIEVSFISLFFALMGVERISSEIYKGFFRTEAQDKYFVPSRITFFGKYVSSDLLRYFVGVIFFVLIFVVFQLDFVITQWWQFALVAYLTGLFTSFGGAYKDAPFEGFSLLKFQRSSLVVLILTPFFYSLGPVKLGLLVYMNGGLERFVVEYYKTYIQRNMSGKFRSDLTRGEKEIATREKFHYFALVIIALVVSYYIYLMLK